MSIASAATPNAHKSRRRWLLWALGGIAAFTFASYLWKSCVAYDYFGPPQTVGLTQTRIALLGTSLDIYRKHVGRYPLNTDGGLVALFKRPTGTADSDHWAGPYLKDAEDILDPWGWAFIYRCPGLHNPDGYDLSSSGPDGVADTEDDITNWSK